MGTIYALLTMGVGSIFAARTMYNLTGEVLHGAGRFGRGVAAAASRQVPGARDAGHRAVRARDRPPAANAISITAVLALIGTLAVPILGGVFPMLVLVAARRRGERSPRRFLAPLGHPLVALGIAACSSWGSPRSGCGWTSPRRSASPRLRCRRDHGVAAVSIRNGVFRPRTVDRVPGGGGPTGEPGSSRSVVRPTRHGNVHLEDAAGAGSHGHHRADPGARAAVGRLGIDLPAWVAPEVALWFMPSRRTVRRQRRRRRGVRRRAGCEPARSPWRAPRAGRPPTGGEAAPTDALDVVDQLRSSRKRAMGTRRAQCNGYVNGDGGYLPRRY